MSIKTITPNEKIQLNKVVNHPVQSWEWGEFREKTGIKVLRLGTFSGNKLTEAYQITVHTIPYTNFKIGVFFKGPSPTASMLDALREFGRKEGLIFIRMEPNVPILNAESWKLQALLHQHGAVPGRRSFTKETFVIDLTKSEEELLKAMHSKTRYNIRVAQRHGVIIEEDNSKEAFTEYLKLTFETAKRQGFYAHTPNYHRLMWETLHPTQRGSGQAPIAHLLTAKYQGKILIAWIVFVWKDTLYYPYGASSDEDRNVMASYAMMWEAIRFGKKLGLKKFDLWGKEEGKGFTRFKEGFSPKVVEFIGTWDLIINPILYWPYRITEALRWILLKAKAKILPGL